MVRGLRDRLGLPPLPRAAELFRLRGWISDQFDPDGLRYVATVLVWMHWFVGAVSLFQLIYRPYYGPVKYGAYALMFVTLMGYNAYIHYRLVSKRAITWRWILSLNAMDAAIFSGLLAISGGFDHYFFYLMYYPSLAFVALIFTSLRFNLLWVTMVAVVYMTISLTAGDGLDFEARDEKPLLMRITTMYAIVLSVNLVARFERSRWRRAVQRERALQRDRVEFSHTVHDTAAQSAYMTGLGIDTATVQAGNADPELAATLADTSRLSRSTIWELRHPINMGDIYEGSDLGQALRSHAASFTNITSVPCEMTQTGAEPPLSIETKGLLFAIAHNALTNVYHHANADRAAVRLEFGVEEIRLSVSDDGAGLNDGYAEQGRGFANMSRDAERLGGRLIVEKQGHIGGATIICAIPANRGSDS